MTKFNLNAYKYPLSSSSAFIETFLNRMFATRFPDHFTQPLEPQAVAVYLNRKGPFVLPRYVMLMHRYDSFHLMHCRLVKELFHAMNDVKIEQYNSFLEAAKVTVRNAPYSIGDIKPENLFLESVASCSYRIRIGDFGLSECPSLYVLGGTYPGLRVARLIQEILGLGTPSTEGAFEKDYFENLEVRGALKRMVKKDDPLSLELALCYTVCLLLRRENVFEVCKADTRHSAIYEAVCVFCRYFEFKDASNRSQLTLVFEALNNVLLSASFKEQLKTEGPLSANVRFLLGVHFETLSAELQANVIPPKPSHITKSEELIFWLSDTKKAE